MIQLVRHSQFKYLIRRKTPCIISIEDKSDKVNNDIHKSLYSLSFEFPLVLYYKISIFDYIKYHRSKSIYGPLNAICFWQSKIIHVVDATKSDDLYRLFWKVYKDSCCFNIDGFIKILVFEKRIPKNKCLECGTKNELNILAQHEDGLISTLTDLPNINYPQPEFFDIYINSVTSQRRNHLNTSSNNSQNPLYNNKTKIHSRPQIDGKNHSPFCNKKVVYRVKNINGKNLKINKKLCGK